MKWFDVPPSTFSLDLFVSISSNNLVAVLILKEYLLLQSKTFCFNINFCEKRESWLGLSLDLTYNLSNNGVNHPYTTLQVVFKDFTNKIKIDSGDRERPSQENCLRLWDIEGLNINGEYLVTCSHHCLQTTNMITRNDSRNNSY